ncbi:MAG: TetR/AcrR family transcriptional regulator, partial [Shewanella sp.]|nr:TetR/AcrR family transcriptional regulator [Shewanella sp.]
IILMCPAPRYSLEQQAEMINQAAVNVIEKSSLLDFKMTAIAKQAGLSVGSLYKYVQTKEDVIMALACDMFEHFHGVATQIYQQPLTMPQKMMSFMLLSPEKSQKYSFDLDLEILATSEPVLRRSSARWKAQMLAFEDKMESLCQSKTRECFESGDYLGDDETEIQQLSVGNWAMSMGFKQIRNHQGFMNEHCQLGKESVICQLSQHSIKAMMHFLNAYPWKHPLTEAGIEETKNSLQQLGLR